MGGGQVQFQSNPAGLVNGILGGYAFYNGATTTDCFATLSGGTTVVAYSEYTFVKLVCHFRQQHHERRTVRAAKQAVSSAMTINLP